MNQPIKQTKPRFTPLQIAMHLYAWSAIVVLLFKYFTDDFSANPIQDLERITGRHAITMLLLALACTPINTIFKWSEPLKRRRALGLYALMYATIHLIIYLTVDYGLRWSSIVPEVLTKPRLIVGFLAFLLMIPLGITSFDIWKKRLGKNWKRLHYVIYLIAPLAVLHYLWSKKGDLLSLQGEVLKPALYGLAVVIFLILRIPAVRKFFASFMPRRLPPSEKQDPA
jgi:sulfoxide reductase heme-binding subunit YedZ